jgi:metal-dependent amidase/aminoacylase/carboxypeptidase family protein
MPSIDKFVRDYLSRNRSALALLGDKIFYFGELGMQEHETAGLMTRLLEEAGFLVERGISGFPTGFCATYGSGSPNTIQCPITRSNPAFLSRPLLWKGRPGIARAII